MQASGTLIMQSSHSSYHRDTNESYEAPRSVRIWKLYGDSTSKYSDLHINWKRASEPFGTIGVSGSGPRPLQGLSRVSVKAQDRGLND